MLLDPHVNVKTQPDAEGKQQFTLYWLDEVSNGYRVDDAPPWLQQTIVDYHGTRLFARAEEYNTKIALALQNKAYKTGVPSWYPYKTK